MALYFVPGRGYVSDQDEGADIPQYGSLQLPDGSLVEWGEKNVREVPWYNLPYQYGSEQGTRFQWEAGRGGQTPTGFDVAPGYVPTLLDWAAASDAGTLGPVEQPQWEELRQQAMTVPLRDVSQAYWGQTPREDDPEGLRLLNVMSPDVGRFLLETRDRLRQGTATPHELGLARQIEAQARDWNVRASVPQESDLNPFGMGDQFMQALTMLSLATGGAGAFGAFGAAGAAGAAGAGGASVLGVPTSTLSTIGTLGGLSGMGTGILGTALDQPWLQRLAGVLSAVGGLAGGTAGIANAAQGGLASLGEAGRLLSGAGRVTGALGTLSGQDALRQAAGYLRLTGGASSATGGMFEGGGPEASDFLTQRGTGGDMDWDWNAYSEPIGPGLGWDAGGYNAMGYGEPIGPGLGWDASSNPAYQTFTGWGDPYGPGTSGDAGFSGEGSGWLSGLTSTLSALAPLLGPAFQGVGSLITGAQGASASRDAAAAQSDALNRALALQEAQWLQQQANQAPWLQAGREALPKLQGMAGQGQPTLSQVAPLSGAGYALPSATPGWTPGTYAGYTPTETPSAAGYRYTPGAVPQASAYRYTPGAVPTLSGAELLANDPGVQFRLDEGRRALEASAAARGGLTSGATLAALQRQGQDLSSQEYANAWQRASQQAQLREQWAQVASQQGWSQAEAETRLREMLAQQASGQNWQQALQEAEARRQQQQFGWEAGFRGQQQGQREQQQWETDMYNRLFQQNQTQYGRDWAQREAENQRFLDAYNAQRQGQGQAWNQYASLAGLGPTAVAQLGTAGQHAATQQASLLGQLGSSQGMGILGNTANWNQGIAGGINSLTSLLGRLNA